METQYDGWKNLREFATDSFYSAKDRIESTIFALIVLPIIVYGTAKIIIDVNRQVLSRVSRPSKLEA